MSKQSESKLTQGFLKKSPMCSNCEKFTFESETKESFYGTFEREHKLRCGIGGFKVGKSNWCKQHIFKCE